MYPTHVLAEVGTSTGQLRAFTMDVRSSIGFCCAQMCFISLPGIMKPFPTGLGMARKRENEVGF